MQQREKSAANLWLAAALIASGTALWIGAVSRNPNAMSMLPGVDGCLVTGIVAMLLALLEGLPYRTALIQVGVPVVAVQIAITRVIGVNFFPMLGVEMLVFGVLGVAFSKLPEPAPRRAPPERHDGDVDARRTAHR
jgi:hypothetical protein